MTWQDLVFATGSVIFSLALIPSIKSPDKPALKTSVTTGVVLAIFGGTYITLGLTYAAVTTFVSSGLWLTLAIQKCRVEYLHFYDIDSPAHSEIRTKWRWQKR